MNTRFGTAGAHGGTVTPVIFLGVLCVLLVFVVGVFAVQLHTERTWTQALEKRVRHLEDQNHELIRSKIE